MKTESDVLINGIAGLRLALRYISFCKGIYPNKTPPFQYALGTRDRNCMKMTMIGNHLEDTLVAGLVCVVAKWLNL